jgi:hypothetical protein
MNETSPPSLEPETAILPEFNSSGIRADYANMVRGLLTSEEIILDFGFNPGSATVAHADAAAFSSRIVLGFPSAVRLYQLLHALLAKRQEAVQQAASADRQSKSPEVKVFGGPVPEAG